MEKKTITFTPTTNLFGIQESLQAVQELEDQMDGVMVSFENCRPPYRQLPDIIDKLTNGSMPQHPEEFTEEELKDIISSYTQPDDLGMPIEQFINNMVDEDLLEVDDPYEEIFEAFAEADQILKMSLMKLLDSKTPMGKPISRLVPIYEHPDFDREIRNGKLGEAELRMINSTPHDYTWSKELVNIQMDIMIRLEKAKERL